VVGGWNGERRTVSESLDLTELENLFHARDDKTIVSSKEMLCGCGCVGVTRAGQRTLL